MSLSRRAVLAVGATALLSGCAIEPPPTIRQQRASESAAAARTRASSLPTAQQPAPTSAATPSETAGSARPANAAETGQAGATHANHTATAAPYAVPAATVHDWLTTRTGPATPTAFLTYDDGPSPNITPQLLDVLKQLGVHATFFLIGYRLEQNPAVAQRALAEGHAIGIHTYSHDYSYLYPGRVGNAERIVAEYDRTLGICKQVLGSDFECAAFRYPGGHMSWKGLEAADAALSQRGVSWVDWNCMTGDSEKKPTQNGIQGLAMVTATLAAYGNPSAAVMLSHDSSGGYVSLQSLPSLVDLFRSRGYGFGVIG